jgi:hypothetical protein
MWNAQSGAAHARLQAVPQGLAAPGIATIMPQIGGERVVHGLSSRDDWIVRVSETHGAEGLCDREWRFLAASPQMLSGLNASASFVGRRVHEIPQFKAYAAAITSIPLFDGSLRGVQCHSEAWVGGVLRAWELDFWAVCTGDLEMLVHIVANPVPSEERGAFAGFRMSRFRWITAEGRQLNDSAGAADTAEGEDR